MACLPGLEEWEKRRAYLSHDLLKNQVAPAVSKLNNIFAGKVEDLDYLQSFPDLLISQMIQVKAEIDWLLTFAEQALSPRQYFATAPLNQFDADTKAWLPDIIHKLWIANIALSSRIQVVADQMRQMEEVSRKLIGLTDGKKNAMTADEVDQLKTAVSLLISCVSEMRQWLPYRL